MMEQQVTLRVRPGETVRFPGLCVACGQPARERLALRKRRGQITRRIDAPLCGDCARQLARRSGQEEQLLRLRWPAAVVAAVLLAALALLALPLNPWWFRLMVGLAFGLPGAAFLYWALTRRSEAAELPERRAVREAARIVDFTWRDMTLAFNNGVVVERVRELNSAGLAADSAPGEAGDGAATDAAATDAAAIEEATRPEDPRSPAEAESA